ncbi:unnamed protein product [Hydatigera taeniaeformis]|uniref:Secreted protein n=1 Tax=Hydatigena taeniaeformis TaxID=6205 RepID=A0A0R3X006_HYDTA|nr:unnamed protein product [Hydatigera taeniaeformis]
MNSRLILFLACLLCCSLVAASGHQWLPVEEIIDAEPDHICGLHPVDILMSSLLRNAPTNDSSGILMLSNAITSLYRTQPNFYAFLMRCTTAWNRCQRAKPYGNERRGAVTHEEQPWQLVCNAGLALSSSDLVTNSS